MSRGRVQRFSRAGRTLATGNFSRGCIHGFGNLTGGVDEWVPMTFCDFLTLKRVLGGCKIVRFTG